MGGRRDYRGRVKSRDPQSKRRALIKAAAEDIVERGYANSTLASTAARIGLTKGAFAYHFPTKADLVAALSEIAGEQVAEADAVATLLYPEGGLKEYLVYDRLTGERFVTDPVMQAMNVMLFDPTTPSEIVERLDAWRRAESGA